MAEARQGKRFRQAVWGGAAAVAALLAGCVAPTILPRPELVPAKPPERFDDSDWAEVLRRYVRGGMVDYAGLAKDRQPLERFVAMISIVGPTATPHLFGTRQDRLCYWINAYNALAVRVVMERWPTQTIYDPLLPPVEQGYWFKVDGQATNLAQLRQRAMDDSAGDIRVLFTMCGAARGWPGLASMPYRPIMLEQQLRAAAAEAVGSLALVRVDHEQQALLVAQVIFSNQKVFLEWYQRRYGAAGATLLNALLALAEELDRQRLNAATGYEIKMLPFDRSLNVWAGPLPGTTP
jgi:hypothetical protein